MAAASITSSPVTAALLSVLLLLLTVAPRLAHSRSLSQYSSPSDSDGVEVQQDYGGDGLFTINSGDITFGGSGCPQGTVQVVASPTRRTISVIFDSFHASTDDGDTRDRKSCNLALPIAAPNGMSVGVFQVDYRGFVNVPDIRDASARLRSEYFWAGVRGPVRSTTFLPGCNDDFSLTDRLSAEAMVWSPCGEDISFRINTSIYARKGEGDTDGEEVEISVDTTDVAVNGGQREPFLEAKLATRRCS